MDGCDANGRSSCIGLEEYEKAVQKNLQPKILQAAFEFCVSQDFLC